MQFEYDPERLIEEVKKRPGIWDFECVEYRSKKQRARLWAEIVNELNQNTANATKSDLRELELQLQKKWKSIRDCFQKYISHPERVKRPYVYSQHLQFLLKDQDQQKAEVNVSTDSEDDGSGKARRLKWKRTIKVKTSRDNITDEDDNDDINDNVQDLEANDSDFEPPNQKVPKLKEFPEQFAFANVDPILKPVDSNDPERLFLLSLLPHLKSIPEDCRLTVKMNLMQVLQNANYNVVRDRKIF